MKLIVWRRRCEDKLSSAIKWAATCPAAAESTQPVMTRQRRRRRRRPRRRKPLNRWRRSHCQPLPSHMRSSVSSAMPDTSARWSNGRREEEAGGSEKCGGGRGEREGGVGCGERETDRHNDHKRLCFFSI